MPAGLVKTARDEALWEAAKKSARKGDYQGDSLWAVTTKIFQNMKRNDKGKEVHK